MEFYINFSVALFPLPQFTALLFGKGKHGGGGGGGGGARALVYFDVCIIFLQLMWHSLQNDDLFTQN